MLSNSSFNVLVSSAPLTLACYVHVCYFSWHLHSGAQRVLPPTLGSPCMWWHRARRAALLHPERWQGAAAACAAVSLPERSLQQEQAQAMSVTHGLGKWSGIWFLSTCSIWSRQGVLLSCCHLSEGFKHKVFSSRGTRETLEPKIVSLAAAQRRNTQM